MSLRAVAVVVLTAPALVSSALSAGKQGARIVRLGDVPSQDILVAPSLITADTCFVTPNQEITTRIDGWVIGYELYKSFIDPAEDCPDPYPFAVIAINMPMIFDAGTPFVVSVDVEAVDSTTDPGCPVPGPLLALSLEYQTTVPEAGLYNIWVPLDTPVLVNGPFFAGFYIGNAIDSAVGAAVLCDDFPATCATYNIWDEAIGWIDLCDNEYFDFPGRLAMEVAGIPGGQSGASMTLQVLSPVEGEILQGSRELWAWDSGVTGEVDYVVFEYSSGGEFTEIGRDFDGVSPLRDGVHAAAVGTGFSVEWEFSMLPEGSYSLRVTMVDNQGTQLSDTIGVYLEPTPPRARVVSPGDGSQFCAPVEIDMTSTDENLTFVEVYQSSATADFQVGLFAINQRAVGDNNGNATDGNLASNGEFGDYYSGPVAATVAAQLWFDRGYPALMQNGPTNMTLVQAAEAFAAVFHTRQNLGTYDEALYLGLRNYVAAHGGQFDCDFLRTPVYGNLRKWLEEERRAVILGIGGATGVWMTLDGFAGWQQSDGNYLVRVANPFTGTVLPALWRQASGYDEINYAGDWQRVDLAVSLTARAYTVSRTMIGVDFNSADGWSVTWSPTGLGDSLYYYFRTVGHDNTGYQGVDVVLVEHNCASIYVPGDYDNDRAATVADLYRLINFIAQGGPAPYGGAARADCNCDNMVNVTDIIYYMNYLYGSASPPCR